MEICFATNNQHKLEEVRALLPLLISVQSLVDIGCSEELPETSSTIEGNSLQKAKFVSVKYGRDCFADDTGLEVEALNGQPGVYSARYAGLPPNFEKNVQKLLHEMEGIQNRNARFRTVVTLIFKDEIQQFEGIVNGSILTAPHGTGGFGYDPVFKPDNFDQSFSEMTPALKNQISHRGLATRKLVSYLLMKFSPLK